MSRPSSTRSSLRKSPNTPLWRSLSLSKRSAPASVSLIFAEPEQGAPLTSATTATTKLPSRRTTEMSNVKEGNLIDSEVKQISGTASNSSTANPTMESFDTLHNPPVNTNAIASASQQIDQTASPESITVALAADPVPFPSSETPAQSSEEMTSSPARSTTKTWFGSISRSKGKDKDALLPTTKAIPAGYSTGPSESEPPELFTPPALPVQVQVQPPTPPQPSSTVNRPATSPQPIPTSQNQLSPKRSWFSSPPNQPTRPLLSPTSPSQPASQTSLTSSVDSHVPSPPLTPPAHTANANVIPMLQMQATASRDSSSVNSLNPSTSRFTLSIPLLGRPKIPLDQAVAVAHKEVLVADKTKDLMGTNDQGHSSTSATTSGKANGHSTALSSVSKPPKVTMISTNVDSPVTTQTTPCHSHHSTQPTSLIPSSILNPTTVELPKISTVTSSLSASSWWDYVGLGATLVPSSTRPGLEQDSATFQSPSTSNPNPEAEFPEIKTPNEGASVSSGDLRPILTTHAPQVRRTQSSRSDPDSAAGASNAAMNQSGNVAWFSPWAWYGYAVGGESAGTGSRDEVGREEEEKAVEEAAALAAAAQIANDARELERECAKEKDVNPIERSITSNASGWAGFFSSRALGVKTITAAEEFKRDERGMEIMDLDDDEGTTTGEDTVSAQAKAVGPQTDKNDGPLPKPKTHGDKSTATPSSPRKSETPKQEPPAAPLTTDTNLKRETVTVTNRKSRSTAPSRKSGTNTPTTPPRPPNLVLPTWADTFHAPPRNLVPPPPVSTLSKTLKFVSGVLFSGDESKGKDKDRVTRKGKQREKEWERRERELVGFGRDLPRAYDVLLPDDQKRGDVLRGCSKVVVIGIHGWFPGAVVRTVLGEPTGTSAKFVNMMVQALEEFQEKHKVKLKKITKIPLEGEGTIDRRVDKLYNTMLGNQDWMNDLHAADVIFVATHSQGSIVSTHLLDKLIRDEHIRTPRILNSTTSNESFSGAGLNITTPVLQPQRVCCLALCGIHLGPLRYLSTSSLLQPYIQYFESTAARELFEFQDTESAVSKSYSKALANVVGNGTKMVYVASLDDQVVPMYSGLFTSVSHPLILRALYIDGDAYHSSDFLSNLLVLLLRVLNSGLSDSGLLAHLSEATAGSLNGVGHSTAYEEISTYSLAVNYLFLTNDGLEDHPELTLEPFNATSEQNDYEIPWALRDLIADERVAHFFSREISELRDAFRDWHPKTTILRDIKRKLQPIQRLPPSVYSNPSGLATKL